MTEEPTRPAVTMPSDDEMAIAFEDYAAALGRVAHAWNYLHEKLGRLFCIVMGVSDQVGSAIWYSSDSDRVKQMMLKAAIGASPADRWLPRLPKAKDGLEWLAERVINLGDLRNDAIHAPCTLVIDGGETRMAAHPFSDHARAKKLVGKDLLTEFDWCERWTEELTRFTQQAVTALGFESYPWPDRPEKPDRKPRKALGRHPPPRKE